MFFPLCFALLLCFRWSLPSVLATSLMTHKQQLNATKLSVLSFSLEKSEFLSSTPSNNGGYEVLNSMSVERSLLLSNGTTTFTFSLTDHTSESLPLSESVSSSVSSSLVSLSWKKKTNKTRLNGSLNHNQHLPHRHHHHLLIRRLSCSLGLVLCVTTSLHLCVKLKLLLVQAPWKNQYMYVWECPFGIIAKKFPKECSARSSLQGQVAQFRVSDRLQKLTLQILCRPRCIVASEARASSTTSSCPSSPSPSRSPSHQRPASPLCSSCPSSSPSSRSRRGTAACEILPAQLVPSWKI